MKHRDRSTKKWALVTGTPITPLSAEFVKQYKLNNLGKQLVIIHRIINKFLFYSGKYLQPRRMNSFFEDRFSREC